MTKMVLDAGALVGWDRGDRTLVAQLEIAQRRSVDLCTPAIVVAQAWRDPSGRQARLARLLRAVHVVVVDERLARRAGELVGRAHTSDPIDATVVLVAEPGDRVLTSDPSNISVLAEFADTPVHIVTC